MTSQLFGLRDRKRELSKEKEKNKIIDDDKNEDERKSDIDIEYDNLNDSSLLNKSNITNSDFDVEDDDDKNYEYYKKELDNKLQEKKKKLE